MAPVCSVLLPSSGQIKQLHPISYAGCLRALLESSRLSWFEKDKIKRSWLFNFRGRTWKKGKMQLHDRNKDIVINTFCCVALPLKWGLNRHSFIDSRESFSTCTSSDFFQLPQTAPPLLPCPFLIKAQISFTQIELRESFECDVSWTEVRQR